MQTVEIKQTNTKAIIGLTLGILSILIPFLGLVLAVIGIVLYGMSKREIVQNNENGSGLAVAGLICSIVGIVIQLFMILGLVSFYAVTVGA
ncbi:DUF4190 domain-containing protein [Sutcliffiella halmapala]|uniref:DUF4190 domain-containing protein n=1 Tax=Sutcliffiella halmapala TaxID=79882 RepID=UPI000994C639|nr:DUF4190 domain-containing protein [Sutcliffiella halmapala]